MKLELKQNVSKLASASIFPSDMCTLSSWKRTKKENAVFRSTFYSLEFLFIFLGKLNKSYSMVDFEGINEFHGENTFKFLVFPNNGACEFHGFGL